MTAKKVEEAKRACKCPDECKDGKHEFMGSAWDTRGNSKKIQKVRCKFCLLELDAVRMENCARVNHES